MSVVITQDYLKSILDYNPDTGIFTWKSREVTHHRVEIWNGRFAGKQAGTLHHKGYITSRIYRKYYSLHRLAFLYVHGFMPNCIDHRDGDKANNRISNLREATVGQNNYNKGSQTNNTSGYCGVHFRKSQRKYSSKICHQNKQHNLGYFDTPEQAARAYDKAAKELHGEFAKLNFPDNNSER